MKTTDYFVNFDLSLENYMKIKSYIDLKEMTNENEPDVDEGDIYWEDVYDSLIFELSISEINRLRNILRELMPKYNTMVIACTAASEIIEELKDDLEKKMKDSTKQENKAKENTTNTKKSLKKRFLDFFHNN